MKSRNIFIPAIFGLTGLLAACGGSPDPTAQKTTTPEPEVQQVQAPTPDEQVAALDAMCAEAQSAMAARQAENSLFNRVGGRDGISKAVAETVRLHQINEPIKHLMEGVDPDHLTKQVIDFLVLATGGQGEYNGRNMIDAHAHMNMTNAQFLAAGSDLGAGMDFAGWGENEKQELLCAFVGLRPQVVTSES